MWSGDVHRAVADNGCGLLLAIVGNLGLPGQTQPMHVFRSDLSQSAEAVGITLFTRKQPLVLDLPGAQQPLRVRYCISARGSNRTEQCRKQPNASFKFLRCRGDRKPIDLDGAIECDLRDGSLLGVIASNADFAFSAG